MKKPTQILGSLALSAALVMGTAVPAFAMESGNAADDKSKTGEMGELEFDTDDHSQGGATTVVNVSTYTSQISVQVPLFVTFSLDTVGGHGYSPTNYMIKNGTEVPVKVSSANASATIEEGKTAPKYSFGTDASTQKGSDAIGGGTIGDLWSKFAPRDEAQADKVMYLQQSTDGVDQTLDWVIDARPAGGDATITGYTSCGGTTYDPDAQGAIDCAKDIVDNYCVGWTATKKNKITTAGAGGWEALIAQIDTYLADGDINEDAAITAEGASDLYTNFPLDLHVDSSVLTKPEATTDNVASIVYTIEVAA